MTYQWRTDAAWGARDGDCPQDILASLVADGEWSPIGSRAEARDLADGAWLDIRDADGALVMTRRERNPR